MTSVVAVGGAVVDAGQELVVVVVAVVVATVVVAVAVVAGA